MKKVFLISGKKFVGKDTATIQILKKFNQQTIRAIQLDLARPLKYAAASFLKIVYGCELTDEYLFGERKELPLYDSAGQPIMAYDQNKKLVHASFRMFAQTMGTEYGRQVIDQDIWTKAVFTQILSSDKEFFIISDCRFKTEIQFFTEHCAKHGIEVVLIRVTRNTGRNDTHQSEIDLDDFHFDNVIENNGTYEEFYQKVEKFI